MEYRKSLSDNTYKNQSYCELLIAVNAESAIPSAMPRKRNTFSWGLDYLNSMQKQKLLIVNIEIYERGNRSA